MLPADRRPERNAGTLAGAYQQMRREAGCPRPGKMHFAGGRRSAETELRDRNRAGIRRDRKRLPPRPAAARNLDGEVVIAGQPHFRAAGPTGLEQQEAVSPGATLLTLS